MATGEWNVLIYMVADDAFGVFTNESVEAELQAIQQAVGPNIKANVFVRADTKGSTGLAVAFKRGRLKLGKLLVEPVAGANDIQEFLDKHMSRKEEDRNLVLFWGHGFGPAGLHYERQFVDPIRLAKAIRGKSGRRVIDLLVLMSCHMSTMELACELDDRTLPPARTLAARYIVASQGLVRPTPKHTFPYADLFKMLKSTSPAEIGQGLVDSLGTDLFQAPFSLLDVSKSSRVADALSNIAEVVTNLGNPFLQNHSALSPLQLSVHDAFDGARTDDVALVDLGRLGRNLESIENNAKDDAADADLRKEVRAAGTGLLQALDDGFVVQAGPKGTRSRIFTGVSAFCPPHHAETDPNRLSTIRRVILKEDYRRLSLSRSVSSHSWQDVVDLTNRDAALTALQK